MEDKIKQIVKNNFNAEVIEIVRITEGYSHFMYDVKINKEPYDLIVRFSNNKKKDVNLAKEKYIIELLKSNNLPVSEIYLFDNSEKEVSEEYMVLEKLEGIRLDTIWESLTKEEKIQITKEIGKLMKKIHAITFEKFGAIEEGGKIDEDIAFKFKSTGDPLPHSQYIRREIKDNSIDFARLISYKYLPIEFFSDFITFICKNLEQIDYKKKPVLIHNDFMTGHLFVKKEGEEYKIVGLIDFELSRSSSPSNDFIKLHRQKFFEDQDLKKALIESYGNINEEVVEILRIIRDISFAQVLFESGDKEKGNEVIKESWGKIKNYLQ